MNVFEFVNPAECTGCGACVQSCPHDCMSLQPDAEGFLGPQIDTGRCRQCGICVKRCPVYGARETAGENPVLTAWAARAVNEEILRISSSGGVFSVLAKRVIGQGGAVVGAAFDGDDIKAVRHVCAEDDLALARLQGSKYLQSDPGDSFRAVKQYLQENRAVLFSGTPCQAAGLKSYLGGDNPRLLTVDVVCHGVPSPKAWAAYTEDLRQSARSPLSEFCFRDKTYGWKDYGMRFSFQNGAKTWESQLENPYFRCFLRNLSLRKSCYNCPFKGRHYASDLTLGDFWGIRHIAPEFSYAQGASLVLVRTEWGIRALEEAEAGLILHKVDTNAVSRLNQTVFSSPEIPELRAEFFDRLGREPFCRISHSLCPRTVRQWALDKIPPWLRQRFRRHGTQK